MFSISTVIPFGQSEVHLGYDHSQLDRNVVVIGTNPKTKVDQWKATYQYNLSKRTALYGTVARLNNKDFTTLSLPGSYAGQTPLSGGDSKGFEIGLRHFF